MSSAKTNIPTVECKVIGNIEWNGFIKENPLKAIFWNDSNLFIMVILPGRHTV